MHRSLVLLLSTCSLLFCFSAFATPLTEAPLGTIDYTQTSTTLDISRGNLQCTTIALPSPNLTVEDQVVDGETYQAIGIPGEPFTMEDGNPSVPQVSRFYRIPNTGGVDLLITNRDFELVDNINPLPYKFENEDSTPVPFHKSSVYQKDQWYPPNVAEISAPMIMRDFRVVRVTLYPVQVNPVTHQARYYHNLSVDVVANNQPGENELLNPGRLTASWAPIYRNSISNLDDDALLDVNNNPGSYLILATTSSQMRPWIDSLRVWKSRKGYTVVVDSLSNWTVSSMIQHIQSDYSNWAQTDHPLEFVCLMGDPSWSGVGVPTDGTNYDHGFALANNNDDLEDIGVGRLSGNSSGQMATINAKIMGYERNPWMENAQGQADTMWYHRGLFYAGIGHQIGSNRSLMRWGSQQFRNYTGVDSTIDTTYSGNASCNVISTAETQGVSFCFVRGAWQFELDCSCVNSLPATWRLPIAFYITCNSNDFSGPGQDGTAECFLTAGSATQPRGGVAAIGTSTAGTHANYNCTVTGGILYAMANLGIEHYGNVLNSGKSWLIKLWGTGGYADNFSRWNNLMGDPSLTMWTDVPKVMNVDHPSTINVGEHHMSLDVSLDANGQPVSDALVCLWKGSETHVTGMTDAQGHVDLPITINTPGDLLVTVTKHNHKPYLYTVPCAQAAQMVALSSYTIDDDNSGGTIGNSNGQLNSGETIDLPLYLRNFGTSSTATGVTANLTSANPRISVVNATSTFANIAQGDSAVSATPFRIHVSPQMQNREDALLSLTVTASSVQTISDFTMMCRAGEARYISSQFTGTVNPGTTNNLRVTIQNAGPMALTGATGQLVSLSPFVQVDDDAGTFGDIAPNNGQATNTADQFTLTSNVMTFRGHQAPMRLLVTTSDGLVDTVQFVVVIGNATATDPTGPDAFGYYAYDNTDVSYEMHPSYNYVNISAGLGQDLNINDPGDPGTPYPVLSVVRALPFPFTFYGQTYDTVTICSNGWVAFGNQPTFDQFRNYPMPSMNAPDAMIAAYWDDLATSGADGVWTYYDAANHQYIVQWKAHVYTPSGAALDFEVILHDEDFYPTFDGNGEVLVQYNVATMGAQGDTEEPNGCTIGIQAPRALVGLQYAHILTYTPGSANITAGRAVLYTTAARMLFGDITGTIHDAANNAPMPGVDVTIDGYNYHTTTDNSGLYLLHNVLIGTYTVRAHKHAYNDTTASNILVELDSTEIANFSMLHPEMALSRDTVRIVLPNDPPQTTFNIVNGGNGPLDYNLNITYAGNESSDPWAQLDSINLTSSSGDAQILGCEFIGDYWWISGGGGPNGGNYLYKYDIHGNYAGSVPQPSNSAFGWFDLAYDGQYIYGSDSHVIVGVDESGAPHDTVPSPLNPSRAIAFDPVSQHFWVADYTSDIYEITRTGTVIQQIVNADTLAITGMAWYGQDPNGMKLYLFCQNGTGSQTQLWRMHPASHVFELVTSLAAHPGDRAGGLTITPGWNSTLLVLGGVLQNSSGDRLGIYEVTFNTAWINVSPSQQTVPGGMTQPVTITIDPSILRPNEYRVNLNISNAVLDTTYHLPVIVDVADAVPEHHDSNVPTEYTLYQNYPNPFNPSTEIRFDVPKSGMVELRIYNTLGQLVRTLVNDTRSAGTYVAMWDGRSDYGENVSTGVYIYQLHAENFTAAKKMVFIR